MQRSLTFTRFLGWLLASEIALLDQWSKTLIHNIAQNTPFPIEITSFFNIVLTGNRGISFGLFRHMQDWMPLVLTGVTSVIALYLCWWMTRAHEKGTILALGCVIGGAIGNIIDRLRLGAVTDFLDFHITDYHWPAFNLADSAIFVGVVILAFVSIVKRDSVEQPSGKTHHDVP